MSFNNFKIEQFSAIIFDLDDTLYEEIEYLKRAYKYISEKIIESESDHHYSESSIYKYFLRTFTNEGRINLFQKAVKKFNIKNFTIEHFLNCLRTVNICENEIPIKKPILDFFIKYHVSKNFFILTNGNITQQKNKIKSINIPFKGEIKIYYSSSLGKELEKPNPYFILKILRDHNLSKEQVMYIGDSETDEKTAKAGEVAFMTYKEFSAIHF